MDGGALRTEVVVAALAQGATILTGNQRAARSLQHQYDLHNRGLGLASWQPPLILAWDAWTAELWQQLLCDGRTARLLLNRSQEHTLWRSIIAADPEMVSLRSLDSLAELAAEAWSRLHAYRGEKRLADAGVSADTRAFQRCAHAFERRCRSGNLLSAAQLEAVLASEIAGRHLALSPHGYVLIGFDSMTPTQQALVQAVRSVRGQIQELEPPIQQGPSTLIAAEDEREELHTAAVWIRRHLEAHPTAQVALIVPALEDRRAAIDRALRDVLAPELQDIAAKTSATPYEFSLGRPLAATPLVSTALDLLRWTTQPLSLECISQLLLSPHFAGGSERNARAAFDAYELRRRRTLRPELRIDGLLNAAESAKRRTRMPRLLAALKAMSRSVKAEGFAAGTSRSAADWADSMQNLLQAADWGGGEDSIEFQAHRRWEGVLDELTTLDFEGMRLTFPDALKSVERLATRTLFAPESRNAPVQVMGPLESAGSSFDAVWFLGAGDAGWPSRPGISPLLPWHLQLELRMPGTDVARDVEHSRRITGRIAGSAPILCFSYARETPDGRQRVSPALAGLAMHEVSASAFVPATTPPEIIPLEDIGDDIAFSRLPDRLLRGGADLLKQQAACGFRAFAEKRLWATALDSSEPGMDARGRGNAVHLALQYFWTDTETQARLKAMPDDDRRTLLAQSIDRALEKTDKVSSSSWDVAYMDVQRERLMALLDPWLIAEMSREVEFLVKQVEAEREVQVGPLRLLLRVDRIDETEHGEVILDYKTGAASPNAWLTDRPDEPQLPLYAILSEAEQLAGVGFAQVRAGKDLSLSGYQTQDGILLRAAKLKEAATLKEQVDRWREVLTQLAQDFDRGDVRVRPKQYPSTCEYCAERLLCRLDISLLDDGVDPESEEDRRG